MAQQDRITQIYQRIEQAQTALLDIRADIQSEAYKGLIDAMCTFLGDITHDPYTKLKSQEIPRKVKSVPVSVTGMTQKYGKVIPLSRGGCI